MKYTARMFDCLRKTKNGTKWGDFNVSDMNKSGKLELKKSITNMKGDNITGTEWNHIPLRDKYFIYRFNEGWIELLRLKTKKEIKRIEQQEVERNI